MITFTQKGNFSKTEKSLKKMSAHDFSKILKKYGEKGVAALKAATPIDTGKTANSWSYRIENSKEYMELVFTNENIQNGVPIAIIIQYGHAARSGAYVQGRDYINPALSPIFDEIAKEAWEEVQKL